MTETRVQTITTVSLDNYRAQLIRAAQDSGLPRASWEGLTEYIIVGRPVGSFLYAVLSNDLYQAAVKADDLNGPRLREYVTFLQSFAPIGCYGSSQIVETWTRGGGVVGRQNVAAQVKAES